MEEVELADQLGLDVFGIGEHHRADLIVSAPAVVLAAAAARTERIRLTSAVTVLSSDDPVRVFQDFATLDLLSGGRAEIMAGRGSFTESFPLFGFDLEDYDELFEEKLEDADRAARGRPRAVVREASRAARRQRRRLSRGRCRTPCRSGSPWAVRPSRRSGPARSACRWRSRSSAACPSGSRRSPSCSATPRTRRGTTRCRALSINSHGYHRRDVAAGDRRVLPVRGGDDEHDRPRARVAADDARAVRGGRDAARRELRRLAAAGDREDPVPARDLRPRSFPGAVQRRVAAPRQADALDRAARYRGRAGRARGARAAARRGALADGIRVPARRSPRQQASCVDAPCPLATPSGARRRPCCCGSGRCSRRSRSARSSWRWWPSAYPMFLSASENDLLA